MVNINIYELLLLYFYSCHDSW